MCVLTLSSALILCNKCIFTDTYDLLQNKVQLAKLILKNDI